MGNKHPKLDGRKFVSLTDQAFPTSSSIPENLPFVRSSSQGKLWSPFYKFGSKKKLKKSTEKLNAINATESASFTDSLFLPEFPVDTDVSEQDFKVLNLIAKGAYGNVLRVKCVVDHKIYAMKILEKTQIIVENAIQQSKDEVTIQDSLGHHPFIVSCHFYWQYKKNLFLVMDYIPNGELLDWWMDVGSFPEDLVRLYVAEVAMVLDFLNRNGVIYRDLKMENLLVDRDYHLKVIDFGLAKWLRIGGRTRTVCGTLHYMAPEVLAVSPYGHAADWWTVGILMYALIAGEFPVGRSTHHVEMAKKVADCDFSLPEKHSVEAQSLVAKLLDRDPTQRLHTYNAIQKQPFFKNFDFDKVFTKAYNPLDYLPKDTPLPGDKLRNQEGADADVFPEDDFPKTHSTPTVEKIVSFQEGDIDTNPVPDIMRLDRKTSETPARKRLFTNEGEAQSDNVDSGQQVDKEAPSLSKKLAGDESERTLEERDMVNHSSMPQRTTNLQKPSHLNLSPPVNNTVNEQVLSPREKIVTDNRKLFEPSVTQKLVESSPKPVDLNISKQTCDKGNVESPKNFETSNYLHKHHHEKRHSRRHRIDDDAMTDDGVDPITPSLIRKATERLLASRTPGSTYATPKYNQPHNNQNLPSKHIYSDVNEKVTPDTRRLSRAEYADVRHEYRASIALYDDESIDSRSKSVPTTPKASRHFISPIDDLETLFLNPEEYTAYIEMERARLNYEDFETDLDSSEPYGFDFIGSRRTNENSESNTATNSRRNSVEALESDFSTKMRVSSNPGTPVAFGKQSHGDFSMATPNTNLNTSTRNALYPTSPINVYNHDQILMAKHPNEQSEIVTTDTATSDVLRTPVRSSTNDGQTADSGENTITPSRQTLIIDTPDAYVVDMAPAEASDTIENETSKALIVEVKHNQNSSSRPTGFQEPFSPSANVAANPVSCEITPMKVNIRESTTSSSSRPSSTLKSPPDTLYQWQTNSPGSSGLSNTSRTSPQSGIMSLNKGTSDSSRSVLRQTNSSNTLSSSASSSARNSPGQNSPRVPSSPGPNQNSAQRVPRSPGPNQNSVQRGTIPPGPNQNLAQRVPISPGPNKNSSQRVPISPGINLNSAQRVPISPGTNQNSAQRVPISPGLNKNSAQRVPISPGPNQNSVQRVPISPGPNQTSSPRLSSSPGLKGTSAPRVPSSPGLNQTPGSRVPISPGPFQTPNHKASRSPGPYQSTGSKVPKSGSNPNEVKNNILDLSPHTTPSTTTTPKSLPLSSPFVSRDPKVPLSSPKTPLGSNPDFVNSGQTHSHGKRGLANNSNVHIPATSRPVSRELQYAPENVTKTARTPTTPKSPYTYGPMTTATTPTTPKSRKQLREESPFKPAITPNKFLFPNPESNVYSPSNNRTSVANEFSRSVSRANDAENPSPSSSKVQSPVTNSFKSPSSGSRSKVADNYVHLTSPQVYGQHLQHLNKPRARSSWQVLVKEMENELFESDGSSNDDLTNQRPPVMNGTVKSTPVTPVGLTTPSRERFASRTPPGKTSPETDDLSEENLRHRQANRMRTPRVRESWQKVIDEGLYFPEVKEYDSMGVVGEPYRPSGSRSNVRQSDTSPPKRPDRLPVESPNAKMQSVKNWYKRIMLSSGMSPTNVRSVRGLLNTNEHSPGGVISPRAQEDRLVKGADKQTSPSRGSTSYRQAMEEDVLGPDESYEAQVKTSTRQFTHGSRNNGYLSPRDKPSLASHSQRFLSEILEKEDENCDVTWRQSRLLSSELNF